MNQALLVIDAQNALIEGTHGEIGVYQKERLVENINIVIEKAKAARAEIVFIRDVDIAGGEGDGFQIHKDIKVPSDAAIFNKAATNAFYGTPLNEYLKSKHIEHVVIMGCQTQFCIDTAVRAATVNNMDVTLVGDGHSTCDSPVLPAEQIINHHNKTLHGHDNVDNFSLVRYTQDELFEPIHNNYR